MHTEHCRDPECELEKAIQISGYTDPAIPGDSVTFSCSLPGYSIIGSNTAICMGNGEWEPDLRMAIYCKGIIILCHVCEQWHKLLLPSILYYIILCYSHIAKCDPPSPPQNYHIITNSCMLEGAELTVFSYQSMLIFGQQSLCRKINIAALCNQEGIWEPIPTDTCIDSSGT